MQQDTHIESAFQVPSWMSPSDARERLDREIDNFVGKATAASAAPDAALALKVTAGLGKTATTLHAIARHGEALLGLGHVLFYVPTLELAERACEDFQRLAPGLPCRVVRGRDALRPDDREKTMCERAELARAVAGFVPSVTQALCRARDNEGKFVMSPCATGCPYLEQKDIRGPHVVFLSHAYLTTNSPVDREWPVALRIIDEKVWPTLTRTSHLSIDDLMRAPPASYPEPLHDVLSRAKAALVDGLQRDLPLHGHLRCSGIDTAQLQELAQAEGRSRNHLDIGPWQSPKALEFQVSTFDKKSFIASRRRERIFHRLSDKEAGHCVGLMLSEVKTEHGSQCLIQFSQIEEVVRDAPLLLLDADADRDITEHLAPGAAFVSIQSPPIADIVQVSDRTLSNSWLLHPEDGERRRVAVLTILAREVEKAAGGGVLVVASKAVLTALHRDAGRAVVEGDDESLRQPLLGAVPRWFGPNTQGVNDFEDYAAIIIVGRLQPGIADIEKSARAVFSKDELPIITHASGPLPAMNAHMILADGAEQAAVTNAHPDPRAQAILAQTRECGTLQAIARLRLVSPNREKRVVILSSLPLPDFPITRLCTFAALERDLEHEPDWRGFLRMEKALRAIMGRSVRGTRLTAAGLTEDQPRDFATESGAARFRRERTTAHMFELCKRIAESNGWPFTPLLLRRRTGGKAVPAIILEDHGSSLMMARSLWPNFEPAYA